MIRSASKIAGQAVALELIGGLAYFILLDTLGGLERPIAFHVGRIVAFAIQYPCTIWIYRRDGLGSIWSWEGATFESRRTAAIALAAGVIGMVEVGKISQYAVPNPRNLLNFANSHVFTACVTAPFMEEVFWRSFLMRRLSTVIGFWQALAISSIVFGLGHPNPLPSIALGAVLGWLYSPRGTGSLLVPVLFHAFHNLASKLPF